MHVIEIYMLSDELKKRSLGYYAGVINNELKIVDDRGSARKYRNISRCVCKVKHLSQYYSYRDLYFARVECL